MFPAQEDMHWGPIVAVAIWETSGRLLTITKSHLQNGADNETYRFAMRRKWGIRVRYSTQCCTQTTVAVMITESCAFTVFWIFPISPTRFGPWPGSLGTALPLPFRKSAELIVFSQKHLLNWLKWIKLFFSKHWSNLYHHPLASLTKSVSTV